VVLNLWGNYRKQICCLALSFFLATASFKIDEKNRAKGVFYFIYAHSHSESFSDLFKDLETSTNQLVCLLVIA
jgi:hypothetical protein